jgi:prepilin-type N-terminal cleavage/methylation domain-containing protein
MTPARRNRGLGLVEMLVSLAIAAALLTAVAAAYAAATSAIQNNDEFFRASQAARVTINQIMAEVRRCQTGLVDIESLEITTASGEKRVYAFDTTNQRISLSLPDQLGAPTYTLARNVDAVQFFTDGQTISMQVTIEVGKNQVTLSGSAMPRRTIAFN